MTCQDYRPALIELARGSAVEPPREHLATCAGCAQFLEQQRTLDAVLQSLAVQDEQATPFLEARLLAEFDSARRPRAIRFWPVAAMAASLLMAVIATRQWQPVIAPVEIAEEPFIEIPYVAPFAPYERAEVKRMDVPVATLMAAGFVVEGPEPSDTVPAEVLVGQDGRVHAVRFITSNFITSKETRP